MIGVWTSVTSHCFAPYAAALPSFARVEALASMRQNQFTNAQMSSAACAREPSMSYGVMTAVDAATPAVLAPSCVKTSARPFCTVYGDDVDNTPTRMLL